MEEETIHTSESPPGTERERFFLPPGGTLGILGGGQLGRMLGLAARRMGYSVRTFSPQPDSPAGQISDEATVAAFDDAEALGKFARSVDALTFEFENIPRAAVTEVERICPVRPAGGVLHICQNREREKNFLRDGGFPHAPFAVVESAEDLEEGLQRLGTPAVLKTADFGYDGKGQRKLTGEVSAAGVWEGFEAPRGVLEQWIPFSSEVSVLIARGDDGATAVFPVAENLHQSHILDLSIVPARVTPEVAAAVTGIAEKIARALDLVGVLAVEFFLTDTGDLLVNELAPRPHNSGHFSFDACLTSQFEQQLRAVCGLPLGAPDLLTPVVMWNLLGDLWHDGEPDWRIILAEPRAKLHLYGKSTARPGRKMGHVCVLAEIDEALEIIAGFKQKLERSPQKKVRF